MNSAMLVFADKPDLAALEHAYNHLGVVDIQDPVRIVTEGEWGWFAINIDDAIRDECSDEELAEISFILDNPAFAQLEYNTIAAADFAITCLPMHYEVWVENDNGVLRSVAAVRKLIQAGIEWQRS